MDDKFWEFINSHWIFKNKEKPIQSMTGLINEIYKKYKDYEVAYLTTIIEDYVKYIDKQTEIIPQICAWDNCGKYCIDKECPEICPKYDKKKEELSKKKYYGI